MDKIINSRFACSPDGKAWLLPNWTNNIRSRSLNRKLLQTLQNWRLCYLYWQLINQNCNLFVLKEGRPQLAHKTIQRICATSTFYLPIYDSFRRNTYRVLKSHGESTRADPPMFCNYIIGILGLHRRASNLFSQTICQPLTKPKDIIHFFCFRKWNGILDSR